MTVNILILMRESKPLNKFIKNVESIHRTFLQFLSAIMVLTPYILVSGTLSLGNIDIIGWVNLLIVGLLHTGITYCMYFYSVKEKYNGIYYTV